MINNIRTEHELAVLALRARERQQAAVAELGQLGLTCESLQRLLDITVATVSSVLDVEYCKVLEALPHGTDLVLRAGVGWRPGMVGHAIVRGEHLSQAGYTLATDKPVIVEDLRTESRFTGPMLLVEHQVVAARKFTSSLVKVRRDRVCAPSTPQGHSP